MIDRFEDEYAFLSNFFPSLVRYDGDLYPTVEHAYQAAKTLNGVERLAIQQAYYAGSAKKLGRSVTLRSGWDEMRLDVMEELLTQKFFKNPLRTWLANTYPHELVEGNWWGDKYWGVCDGEGENQLGYLLEAIREGVRS